MPFQTVVPITPAIGVPGAFASVNPRQFVVSGTADQFMIADDDGVAVGRFAILNADGTVTSQPAAAAVEPSRLGFVHRYMGAALITTWLAENSNLITPGQPVELFATGDFFAVADAITGTPTRGAAVIWNPTTGLINIGATAAAGTVDTGFVLLSETATAGQIVMIGRQNPITAPASAP